MTTVVRLQHTSIPMPPDGHTEARRLYGELLGMREVLPPVTLPREQLIWFKPGDSAQEIHLFADESMAHNSSGQHLCLEVDDLAEVKVRLAEAGYAIEETIPVHNRPRFFIRDAFGNQIEITQVTGDYE